MKKIFIWGFLYYLRFFAKLSLAINKPKIIGITGSVGKSSARNVTFAILKDYFKVRMIKEGNSETGIPLGILGLSPGNYQPLDWVKILILSPFRIFFLKGFEILIVEMGVDSPYPPKNMDYLLSIVRPNISVVLNAYPVHTEQFDSTVPSNISGQERTDLITKKIAEEKMKIITQAKPSVGILNENLASYNWSSWIGTKLLTFGESKTNNIYYGDYNIDLKKSSFELILPSQTSQKSKKIIIEIKDFFLPKKYEEILSVGFLVGLSLGLKVDEIKKSLINNFFLPSGRSSFFQGINDSVIIDSSYNASRAPLITFIETANQLSKKEKRPLAIILGDMRELGKEAEHEHKIIADLINKVGVDKLYCVGMMTQKYVLPKVKNSHWFKNSIELGKFLRTRLPYRAVVLVKGSQNTIFLEEAIKFILKNNSDEKKLCRQNDFWLSQKSKFFQGA